LARSGAPVVGARSSFAPRRRRGFQDDVDDRLSPHHRSRPDRRARAGRRIPVLDGAHGGGARPRRLGAQSAGRLGRSGVPGGVGRGGPDGGALPRRTGRGASDGGRGARRRRGRLHRLRGAQDGLRPSGDKARGFGPWLSSTDAGGGAAQALDDLIVGLLVAGFRIDHVNGVDEPARALGLAQAAAGDVVLHDACREVGRRLVRQQVVDADRAQIEVQARVR